MSAFANRLRALPSLPSAPPGFDPGAAPEHPDRLFLGWFDDAVEAGERVPHACVLSTGDGAAPDARVLILKDLAEGVWSFAGSARSAKGRQLAVAPRAALTFFWPQQGRSVRVRGAVSPAAPAQSAEDFRGRGAAARAVALASLVPFDPETHAAAVARAAADPSAIDPDWTLWRLAAESVEFWQGRPDRDHLRLRYRRAGGVWTRERLAP